MKHLLIVLSTLALGAPTVEATCKSKNCQSTNACCSATRWYKAKDGTYREMLPYAKALSRAEDADDMEIVLRGVREELVAANAALEAAKVEAAAVQTALEAQVAELTKQLESEKQQAVAQADRAESAEAAHKQVVETVAQLRDEAKRQDENLAATKAELKSTTGERDALTASEDGLKKQVEELTAAAAAAEEARKKAEDELNKMKQDAAESKKAEVEEETNDETPEPGADGDKPADPAVPPAPDAPAGSN